MNDDALCNLLIEVGKKLDNALMRIDTLEMQVQTLGMLVYEGQVAD